MKKPCGIFFFYFFSQNAVRNSQVMLAADAVHLERCGSLLPKNILNGTSSTK